MEKKRSLKQQDRLRLTYKPDLWDEQVEVELPLRLMVMGDFTRRPDDEGLRNRETTYIAKDNFNEVMALHKICLKIRVNNYLAGKEKGLLNVKLNFACIEDFKPFSIVRQVPELKEFIKPFDFRKPTEEELDVFCKQLDIILHHPDFQQLEAAWMGLKFLVDRTNFRENIGIVLLNISKEDLFLDHDLRAKTHYSGLFQKGYDEVMFGSKPYGAIIANYEFGIDPQDISLLQDIAKLAAIENAPFIASASPKMFGLEDFRDLYRLKDLSSIFYRPEYTRWRAFRESQDSRYVCLTLPRFRLRPPHENEIHSIKGLIYKEDISAGHEHYLWGNTAFALASRITDSFAKYRHCANIIGPKNGGMVEGLPIQMFDDNGNIQIMNTVEVPITDILEFELGEEGFIPLCKQMGRDSACFLSANSVQEPKLFSMTPEGRQAFLSYKLGAQLPYLFIITRFAHYIKVLYQINIGMWKDRKDLIQDELNNWIGRYVMYMDGFPSEVCNLKPLRAAQIVVEDLDPEIYRYRFLLKVSPRFKDMGEYFNLELVGILM